jgi:hypothetical protein
MAIQLERDALLSYTNLCEEHKLDCATGHRPFTKCASCLLTTATRMRFKAENERDDAEQRIAKLTADLQHGETMYIAMRDRCARSEEKLDASEAENTRLKAPVSASDCIKVGLGLSAHQSDFKEAARKVDRIIRSRATRTPPQEGQ